MIFLQILTCFSNKISFNQFQMTTKTFVKKGNSSVKQAEQIEIWKHTYETSIWKFPVKEKSLLCTETSDTLSATKDIDESTISVVDMDCIKVAHEYVLKGKKVCMLNMASKWKPGGGVENGSTAQEEHLCRASNLYLHLKDEKYPLPDDCCILSKNVVFFKDNYDYSKLKKPWTCDIVSIAAIKISKPSEFTSVMYQITLKKIKLLLCTAKEANPDILILSALGCGAYNNPNDQVAKAFYQVLVTEGLAKKFQQIVFAIINDKNSVNNFEVFQNVFKQ